MRPEKYQNSQKGREKKMFLSVSAALTLKDVRKQNLFILC